MTGFIFSYTHTMAEMREISEMRVMKRILATALCVVMILGVTGCGESGPDEDDRGEGGKRQEQEMARKPLYEQGLHVLALMNEKAHSEEYLSAMGASQLTDSEYFQIIKSHDYITPDKIYTVVFPNDMPDMLLALAMKIDTGEMSDALRESLYHQFFVNIPTLMISSQGATAIAVASLITENFLFVDDSVGKQNLICLYCFEDAYPIVVTFTYGEDGAIEARGSFLIVDDFAFDSEEEVWESFEHTQFGRFLVKLDDLEITQVK